MKNSEFTKNVIIITGASSGIGRELAMQLAAQGANLSLTGRNEDRLNATAESCRQSGAKVLTIPADLSRAEECHLLIARTVQEYGRIDTLINNAGNSIQSNLEEYPDPTALEQMVQINYLGSAYCTFYALPYLKQSHGRLVAISSLAGLNGIPGLSGYAASKHAMTGFFDSMRLELMKDDVSVTVVYPGSVASHPEEYLSNKKGANINLPPGMMSLETCARLTLQAAASRRRDLVMPPGKFARWMNLLAPGFLDRMILNGIEKDRTKREVNND
jgi:short-subunit dehydrogenase